jgi:hypothetical protein
MIALLAAALALGCIGSSPVGEPASTTLATVQPIPPSTTTTSASSTLPVSSSTLPAAGADEAAVCSEARANRTVYLRCKKAASGELSLPQSELRRCADIQRNAGAYSRLIFRGLQSCGSSASGGLGGDEGLFCRDMGQPDRDQCYLSVRMCDQIEDAAVKGRCLGGLELKRL